MVVTTPIYDARIHQFELLTAQLSPLPSFWLPTLLPTGPTLLGISPYISENSLLRERGTSAKNCTQHLPSYKDSQIISVQNPTIGYGRIKEKKVSYPHNDSRCLFCIHKACAMCIPPTTRHKVLETYLFRWILGSERSDQCIDFTMMESRNNNNLSPNDFQYLLLFKKPLKHKPPLSPPTGKYILD
ncbi:hypothetical protein AGLY_011834 [Aphis glycines]|uniref:Uncharacterized protein n=1 Tax=Aphis glycines TaxID=307491 RepID=A0A6G0TC94_APHGL|nr:hypothetical protein AGLY_011834 [Aphis glycines]